MNEWGQWEEIHHGENIAGLMSTARMKVPGGWVMRKIVFLEGYAPSVSLCFVKEQNIWTILTNEKSYPPCEVPVLILVEEPQKSKCIYKAKIIAPEYRGKNVKGEEFYWSDCESDYLGWPKYQVTHWMYLPEKPKND